MISAAERRALLNGESKTYIRVADFLAAVPALTGKVELVYEGEQEGAGLVAQKLMGKAIRTQFLNYFPEPDKQKKLKEKNAYKHITDWFGEGHTLDILQDMPAAAYNKSLTSVPGLAGLVEKYHGSSDASTKLFLMEFCLHGLAEHSLISRNKLTAGIQFKDLLSSMFSMPSFGADDDEDDDDLR
jgi:magnesium chelatase subunit I